MNENKDRPPEDDEPRTVFIPAGGTPTPTPSPAPSAAPPAPPPAEPTVVAGAEPSATPTPAPSQLPTQFVARTDSQGIKVGDVLNHIFEVKRFIARGGMGEVFEGANVNSDEKVAIKVMLPSLAADEKVVNLFRREARTLTRLQHEALVNYRVLAQEPQLGVLYIVTEYIDGLNLADTLGKSTPSPEELAGLLRRLASGLRAAHQLGAVHRDLSPDNVILAEGKLSRAKIIDFGIAKDLDASAATIVGEGFAGKLNYVAPEQLGDFGREIGPWTDVYSLALVILAVATGRNVDMSGSLVDAIDKRRKGPDLSKVSPLLRPTLESMLKPDPKQRLRSMDEVLQSLDRAGVHAPHGEEATRVPATGPLPSVSARSGGIPKPALIGGAVAAVLAIGAVAWFALGPGEEGGLKVGSRDPAETARAAINSVLPSVSCTWLEIGSIRPQGEGLAVAMRGVAGNSQTAQADITRTLEAAGIQNATVDFGDVAPITPAGCSALDTYRQVRVADHDRLITQAPRFEMTMQPAGAAYAGKPASTALIDVNLDDPNRDVALLGIEPSGAISTIVLGREAFNEALAASVDGKPISKTGDDRYRLTIDVDNDGWSGIILLTGKGPFDAATIAPPIGTRGPDWQQRFVTAAAEHGWDTEMVWFESVNDQPN